MELINSLLDSAMNLDHHLFQWVLDYGAWMYVILFSIVFMETGLVVMAFLPGDILLFTAGTFCAGVQNDIGQTAELNLLLTLAILIGAAILGDGVNYYLGKSVGLKILKWKIKNRPIVKDSYLLKTNEFYKTYEAKTIIIARFLPIIRTFAPFVAGIGSRPYGKFSRYNIVGALVWVFSLVFLGYFFGNLTVVKENFETVIFGIIILSLVPMFIEIIRNYFMKKQSVTP